MSLILAKIYIMKHILNAMISIKNMKIQYKMATFALLLHAKYKTMFTTQYVIRN